MIYLFYFERKITKIISFIHQKAPKSYYFLLKKYFFLIFCCFYQEFLLYLPKFFRKTVVITIKYSLKLKAL